MNRYLVTGLMAVLALALSGCATKNTSLYGWGSYQQQVYHRFQGEGSSPEEQIASLEESLQKFSANGLKAPPGYHAHLGMLYASIGKEDQLVQQLNTEKTLFPESAPYMDFLMRNYKKGAAK